MALDDPGTPAGDAEDAIEGGHAKAAGKPKGDKREALLIVISAIGVIIAYLTLRHLSGAGTPAAGTESTTPANSTTGTTDPSASTGTLDGYSGGNNDQYFLQLQQEIEEIQTQLPPTSSSSANPPRYSVGQNLGPNFANGAGSQPVPN